MNRFYVVLVFLVGGAQAVYAHQPLPCVPDPDGRVYVEWKEHRLKVWPREIKIKAGDVRATSCFYTPIIDYEFRGQAFMEMTPQGDARDPYFKLIMLDFYLIPDDATLRPVAPDPYGKVFKEECAKWETLSAGESRANIEYCEFGIAQDPAIKHYRLMSYQPDGKPFEIRCTAYKRREFEVCTVEYDLDSALAVRYRFTTLAVTIAEVEGLDRKLRNDIESNLSKFN